MEKPARMPQWEQRWPVGLAIVAVLLLLTFLPGRIRILPFWVPWVTATALLASMGAAATAAAHERWLRVEHVSMLVFSSAVVLLTSATLAVLVRSMIGPSSEVGGPVLLASSIAVWVTNVLAFSLIFWQLDRGGPGNRSAGVPSRPDWLFPQQGAPEEDVPPGWKPVYVDYLFLSYSTATAFSATGDLPLTLRAKVLMMIESTISLVTIVVVASRAINILGG